MSANGFMARRGALVCAVVLLCPRAAFLEAGEQAGVAATTAAPAGHSLLAATAAASPKPFSIEHRDGQTWLIRPNGQRFFSLGVCCVDMGTLPEKRDRANPSYSAWSHHTGATHWAEATLTRLKTWGFTTVGGWSDFQTLKQCSNTYPEAVFTPVLHIGSTAGAPWWDMWNPTNIARMDQVARDQILPLRDDPRLLGYYTDNEMGWWNAPLLKMTLEQPPASGQRQRLIALLQETYHRDWAELVRDFEPHGVTRWEELEQRGMLYLRPGAGGIRTLRKFTGLLADRYYALVHDIIRKYDQRGLILGDRYQSFFYPEVARAAAPYVDAVSSNLNAPWNDGSLPRFYLDTLHALTGKPVLIGEFYMAASRNRSGNRNNRGVFPRVTTQAERAAGFANTLGALLKIPYVVGADWFQYYDEPTHGRVDGENYNFGLVDIHDRPYEALIDTLAELAPNALRNRSPSARQDASAGVPPAPRDPLGRFQLGLALRHWDRERGFVKPTSDFPMADLYVCWNTRAVYLGLYSQDVVEGDLYRDNRMPDCDRAEWRVAVGGMSKPICARLGAGLKPTVNELAVRLVNLSGLGLNVRNIAAMELPAWLFGRDKFRPGDPIEFDVAFSAHCQAYRTEWHGKYMLRAEP